MQCEQRILSTVSGVLAGELEEMRDAERGSRGVMAGEPFQHVHQSGDCSQVENEPDAIGSWMR